MLCYHYHCKEFVSIRLLLNWYDGFRIPPVYRVYICYIGTYLYLISSNALLHGSDVIFIYLKRRIHKFHDFSHSLTTYNKGMAWAENRIVHRPGPHFTRCSTADASCKVKWGIRWIIPAATEDDNNVRIEKSTRSNAGNKQYKCHTQKEMEERILRCHRVHFFPVLVFFSLFLFYIVFGRSAFIPDKNGIAV